MKKRIIAAVIAVIAIAGISSSSHHPNPVNLNVTPAASQSAPVQSTPTPASAATDTTTPTAAPVATPPSSSTNSGTKDTNLSNNNTYTNVDGNTVHSPAASTNSSVPVGATAKCGDGTFSFSQHHSGTCSHHGGVASWL